MASALIYFIGHFSIDVAVNIWLDVKSDCPRLGNVITESDGYYYYSYKFLIAFTHSIDRQIIVWLYGPDANLSDKRTEITPSYPPLNDLFREQADGWSDEKGGTLWELYLHTQWYRIALL